ncbi:serine hydrolase [Amycolatopsis vancoresmycina]|uniref:Beta-lactamase/prolyl oligopeptidase n=1 Tax=Amycolatopsis vancoresmycina DSM 44592 TaxID=1292037 RepID=R1HU69_9PSEU|nr:beta-lactamase/prolyl oligopeptidase [Amycolatopsis vancoresmycina DSM 44592]
MWSPDGTRLAFLRAQDGPPQLWLLPADGGEPEQVSTLPLGAGTPVWRPDGTEIAFAAPVDLAADEGEDAAARARRASAPVVADRLDFKADGAGLLRTLRKHVHVLDVATGEVRRVTSGDWHAGDPAWSPDGTLLAFPAGPEADADLTFRSGAYVVEPGDRGAEPRLIGSGEGMCGAVAWTADGAALLAVGRRDTAPGHLQLLRIPVDGGETTDLAAPLDRNVMPGAPGYPGALPQLSGTSVLFCARDRGYTHLYAVDGAGPRLVVGGAGTTVAAMSVAGDTAAIVLATPTSYGEIATVSLPGGEVEVRTAHGPADLEPFTHEEREFTVSDGTTVSGWLLRDPARTGPRPLLLDIHGGPHNAWSGTADAVHLYHQELAARGWAVLLLNPRGSDGYGEAFYTAAVGAWGLADAKDFLEPLDDLVAEGVADAQRLAVAGYSYGGFMTCYLTSRDDRFAAAVAGGVVSDVVSMAGTSDAGHYLGFAELDALPSENRAHYAALSPLSQVEKVRTPTLVVQGAADDRCPAGQAEQWFTALREQGVPARMVLYPGASHLFILNGKPSHRTDFNRRIVDWVSQYAGEPGKPARVPLDAAHWRRRLAELARKHRVPGASLGILRGDDRVVASHGVLNTATGVEVTDDSVFQIGSITKVWTATVAMQLIDEGLLDLDAPVADVLPELRLADPDVTKQVTLRHLLTHTSGIDGDVFTDTGRGDDCIEKFVGLLPEVAQNHPLGATLSYCNSGFVLAGRVIEKLTGQTWDAALRERLFTPLGLTHTGTLPEEALLTHTGTLPEEALLHRAAMGHVAAGDGEPQPAPAWGLPRSAGPAGLITASAADVLAFARMHLAGGLDVLSEASAAAMTEWQADMPDKHTLGDSWGLGWIRFDWDGHRVIGHDGNTIGQSAFLRLLPSHGLAVTLLTNGGNTRDLYEELYREIFAALAGVALPQPVSPPAAPPSVDVAEYLGVYERASMRIEVFEGETGLRMRQTVTGPIAALVPEPTTEHDLIPLGGPQFAFREPGARSWISATFYTLPTGERYLHSGVRATPKVPA